MALEKVPATYRRKGWGLDDLGCLVFYVILIYGPALGLPYFGKVKCRRIGARATIFQFKIMGLFFPHCDIPYFRLHLGVWFLLYCIQALNGVLGGCHT